MISNWLKISVALVCGFLTNFAFEPAGIYPLVIVTLAVLFGIWGSSSPKLCALTGFAFGLGLFGYGISWLYISIHEFGAAPPALAVIFVMLLVCLLSMFIALCGYLQAIIDIPPHRRYLYLIPSMWVMFEWIRTWVLTGFPWLIVGYSQTDSWIAGWANFVGVLGVSMVVCVVAGVIAYSYLHGLKLTMVTFGTLIVLCGIPTLDPSWIHELPPIKVALVQGDIEIHDKWDPQQARHHLNYFVTQTEALSESDLVIWPEIALSYTDTVLEKLKLWELLQSYPPDVLLGVLEEQTVGQETVYYNSAVGISDEIQKYRKSHLVPFGEYTPFRFLLGWLKDFVIIPSSDMSAYDEPQKPLMLAGQPAGVSICFEDAFPSEILKMLPEASYLINISEDAWFGRVLAPAQRLQMSRMRAMETGRPVLRVANKGISASIDHKGQVIDQLSQADGKVLMTAITPTTGKNTFVKLGNITIIFIFSICLLNAVMLHFKTNKLHQD